MASFIGGGGPSKGDKTALKKAEVKLSASMACHASMSAVDHIGEVVKQAGSGSIWEKSRIHRQVIFNYISI